MRRGNLSLRGRRMVILVRNVANRIFNPTITSDTLQRKLESTQEELMRTQIRYQKEIEKLEKDNRELKKQLLLRGNDIHAKKKIKVDVFPRKFDLYYTILVPRNPSSTCTLRFWTSCQDMILLTTRLIIFQGKFCYIAKPRIKIIKFNVIQGWWWLVINHPERLQSWKWWLKHGYFQEELVR